MTKRFLVFIGIIIAVVIGLSVVLISSCINNKDNWLDKETGILLAKPGTIIGEIKVKYLTFFWGG